MNRAPLALGEWYHCYSRGVDKRVVFKDQRDYERFRVLMYVANNDKSIHISNIRFDDPISLFNNPNVEKLRNKSITEVGAYCLMPNHVHVVLKEACEGGVARYMQKLFTGYTMYFNKKYERTGSLFSGTYKSKHIADDDYLQSAISYVHMNPIELFESSWKKGKGNLRKIEASLNKFPHSSYVSFLNSSRLERCILGSEIFELYESRPLRTMLRDAQAYYRLNYEGDE